LIGLAKADRLGGLATGCGTAADGDASMPIKLQRKLERWIRAIAGICAAVLLLAQTAGAAHFHSVPSAHQSVSASASAVADGLCGLCLVRFHSPGAFAVSPHPVAPAPALSHVLDVPRRALVAAYRSYRFGRAPPAPL